MTQGLAVRTSDELAVDDDRGEVTPPRPASRLLCAASRGLFRFAFARCFFDLQVEGARNVPREGPALVVSNHPTYLDPFLVGHGVPRRWVTWMAWEEALSWPVVGPYLRALGAFPVNLGRPRPSTLRNARAVLAEGRLLGMFFEGGRSQGFDLDPPRRGAARLALTAEVPVVPVTISGARLLWPRERAWPEPGTIVVRFHPPIRPADVSGASLREREERLTELMTAAIRSALPHDGRPRPRARPRARGARAFHGTPSPSLPRFAGEGEI